jgi:hypothetical protein
MDQGIRVRDVLGYHFGLFRRAWDDFVDQEGRHQTVYAIGAVVLSPLLNWLREKVPMLKDLPIPHVDTWKVAAVSLAVLLIWAVMRANYRNIAELRDKQKDTAPKAYFKLLPREDMEEKKYLNLTPGDLERLFMGKTDKQIEELAKPFIGMLWAFKGIIAGLHREMTFVHNIRIAKCAPSEPQVYIDFSDGYRQYAFQCYEGKEIVIEGKIRWLNATGTHLYECTPVAE